MRPCTLCGLLPVRAHRYACMISMAYDLGSVAHRATELMASLASRAGLVQYVIPGLLTQPRNGERVIIVRPWVLAAMVAARAAHRTSLSGPFYEERVTATLAAVRNDPALVEIVSNHLCLAALTDDDGFQRGVDAAAQYLDRALRSRVR